MNRVALGLVGVGLCLVTGCQLLCRIKEPKPVPVAAPTYSQYRLSGWDAGSLTRVAVLPVHNESQYTRAGDEFRGALIAELQRLGRFEVIATPAETTDHAREFRRAGRFHEGVLLDVARTVQADAIVYATVTHYTPYPRPALGVVVQLVGPLDGKVLASVDGLWDTTDGLIAERVRTFYRQTPRERPPWIRNHVIASDDGFASELALDSPALFQRFVGMEIAATLLGLPVHGVVPQLP